MNRVLRVCVLTAVLAMHATLADAMEYVVKDSVLTVSGPITGDDAFKLKTELTPAIKYLVLKSPKGNDFQDALYAGGAVRDAKVTTVVQGNCGYACARLFLAGEQRMYSGDANIEDTFVELSAHAYYFDFSKTSDDSQNLKSVVSFPFGIWLKYAFPNTGAGTFNTGAILVFHPDAKKVNGVMGCSPKAKKREDCETLADLNALGTKVATTPELFHAANVASPN